MDAELVEYVVNMVFYGAVTDSFPYTPAAEPSAGALGGPLIIIT